MQPQWHGGLSGRDGQIRPVPPGARVRTIPFPAGRLGDGLELSPDVAQEVLARADDELRGAAAVIIDYTQGGRYPAPAYQDVLARKARAAGALWIADEVVTGFGKCGRWMNFQRGSERPDMVTLGKCLGGGVMPLAAVILSQEVVERIGDASWQSYSALRFGDAAAAAAAAFVRVVAEEELVARARRLHDVLHAGMAALVQGHPSVSRLDGCGLHWWIELGETD